MEGKVSFRTTERCDTKAPIASSRFVRAGFCIMASCIREDELFDAVQKDSLGVGADAAIGAEFIESLLGRRGVSLPAPESAKALIYMTSAGRVNRDIVLIAVFFLPLLVQ